MDQEVVLDQEVMLRIAALKNSLTNAEKKVAAYVLDNRQDVLNCSISDLAERCDVGETSVFRFCKSLNFKGFSEFKMAVALSLSTDEVTRLVMNREISLDDGVSDISAKLLANYTAVLNDTRSLLDENGIERAVDAMVQARRILMVGAGASLLVAMNAYTRFLRIESKVRCAQDTHTQAVEAAQCGEGDVVVAVSYSGLTMDTVACAKIARDNGAQVIAVTSHLKTPLTQNADIVLLCGSSESKLQPVSATAMISANYLLDIMYVEYFKRTYPESLMSMDKTTASVMDKLL